MVATTPNQISKPKFEIKQNKVFYYFLPMFVNYFV